MLVQCMVLMGCSCYVHRGLGEGEGHGGRCSSVLDTNPRCVGGGGGSGGRGGWVVYFSPHFGGIFEFPISF